VRNVHRVRIFQGTYRFKVKETYYLVGARLLVDTVNEHDLNGLDVKVNISRLNSINKCLLQSLFCAWERQAKFAASSGPHQDVYDLHDVMMSSQQLAPSPRASPTPGFFPTCSWRNNFLPALIFASREQGAQSGIRALPQFHECISCTTAFPLTLT